MYRVCTLLTQRKQHKRKVKLIHFGFTLNMPDLILVEIVNTFKYINELCLS